MKQREVLDEKWGRRDKQKQGDNENRSREEEGKQLKNEARPIGILCRASHCMGLMCFKTKGNCIYVYKPQGLRGN